MTIERARKLLGKIADNLSNEEIGVLIAQTKSLANTCIEKIKKQKILEGFNFLDKVK
jgi:hypothetical protein